jgi:hypothetical protein
MSIAASKNLSMRPHYQPYKLKPAYKLTALARDASNTAGKAKFNPGDLVQVLRK